MDSLLDPRLAETRVLFALAAAEFEQRAQWRASAATFRAIDEVLREAQQHPEVFLDEQMIRGDAVELSVRAAVADLAVRLNLSEVTVRNHGHVAGTLRERMPSVWAWFCEGEISTQNAREASSVVLELPAQAWSEFDARLLEAARTLAPARFRAKARAVREQVEPTSLPERRRAARERRLVYSELDRDGMSWLHAYLPTEQAALATAHVDGLAFELFREADETRTLNQLRADVLADLLAGASSSSKATFTVALTIPALSLLRHSTESALLEGVGPIDIDTARQLAGEVPSFTRLLTEPFSKRVLQLDTRQRRPSAALTRWLRQQHATCDFPGCGRRAVDCDLDHTDDWATGGPTSAENLTPRCRKHHTMKHQTMWKVEQPPGADRAVWTSPTGFVREADPPLF